MQIVSIVGEKSVCFPIGLVALEYWEVQAVLSTSKPNPTNQPLEQESGLFVRLAV